MRISHLDNNKNKSKKIIICLIIFCIVNYFGAKYYKEYIINPYNYLFQKYNKNEIYTKNIEIEKLNNQIFELQNIIKESNLSEDLINKGQLDVILANKIKLYDSFYSKILIDKGSVDGVYVDAIVYSSGMHPIGQIVEVNKKSSIVNLFTNNKVKITGVVDVEDNLDADNNIIKNQENKLPEESILDIKNTPTNTSTLPENDAKKSKLKNTKYNIELIGDGAYGFISKVPSLYGVKVSDIIYSDSENTYSIGEVKKIEKDNNEDVDVLYINSYYSSFNNANTLYVQK